jgi:cytochrome c oxidase subunit 2
LTETGADPPQWPLADGLIPEEAIARTENCWAAAMLGMIAVMVAIIMITGVTHALNPPSNVETVDPATLHLGGEFAESNLGTAIEPDGSVTVRLIAEQYGFVPDCARVPVDTPVKFRITSTDVIHGFLLPATNVNTMVVPGFIAEVRTTLPGRASTTCLAMSSVVAATMACGRASASRRRRGFRN